MVSKLKLSASKNLSTAFISLVAVLLGILHFGIAKETQAQTEELILGRELIEPGISVVFEGAVKDMVSPTDRHLAESKTDVHLEALVNWSDDESVPVPKGTVRGGFIPYLKLQAELVNERTGEAVNLSLVPHINLIDNFHYARNIDLPGEPDDTFKVTFYINPPQKYDMAYHRDFKKAHGTPLFKAKTYTYKNVSFESVIGRTRN